jgi:hypothetical protein
LLSWKRVSWNIVDALALFLSFATWLFLMTAYGHGRKSLSNLAEPFFIAFAVPVALLIRVKIGKRFPRMVCSWSFVALLSAVAACVFWRTPALRE